MHPSMNEETTPEIRAPREVNFPAITWDYRILNDDCGLGLRLVANRNIKKGEQVFPDSYEFLFADVQDGDVLRFDRHEKASRRSPKDLPAKFPLTRDVLLHTHGVPALQKDSEDKTSAGTVSWVLEVPGMLMNHSCDPSVKDDSHDSVRGEAIATRDIKPGEELTADYTFQFYDYGPFIEECLCGRDNCRGKMIGFKGLTKEQKEKALPFVSGAVKAMYEADLGVGLPVKIEQKVFPPRTAPKEDEALRMVVPGPSHAYAPILLQQSNETGQYGLYATKDFQPGEQVYEFWTQQWPEDGTTPIDMTFSTHLLEGDPQEGAVMRVHPLECAKRDRECNLLFSGWDLFTTHSCEPNIVYSDKHEESDEDDDWHATFACLPIKKGELLTVDFNSIWWDRTEWDGLGDGVCNCSATNCRGTVKGFRFLSDHAKEELRNLSWQRSPVQHNMSKIYGSPGEALTPHVRVSWRAAMSSTPGVLGTSSIASAIQRIDSGVAVHNFGAAYAA